MIEKKKRGGSREGSGRKKIVGLKSYSLLLTESDMYILRHSYGGLTKAVRYLLTIPPPPPPE